MSIFLGVSIANVYAHTEQLALFASHGWDFHCSVNSVAVDFLCYLSSNAAILSQSNSSYWSAMPVFRNRGVWWRIMEYYPLPTLG